MTVTKGDIAKRFGVSRATIHRELLKERKIEEAKALGRALKARKASAE